MNFKTLTLLLLSFTNCFSQVDFRENYYPKIYEAENGIVKDNLKEANVAYDKAFSFVKKPLAMDIFNATVCKLLLNDMDGAKFLLIKLAKKGISTELLEKKEIFSKPEVKKMWENFKPIYEGFQKEAESAYNVDFISITKALRDSIDLSYNSAIFTLLAGKEKIAVDFSKVDFTNVDQDKLNDSAYIKSLPKLDSNIVKLIENKNSFRISEARRYGKELVKKELENGGIWPEESTSFTDDNFSKNDFLSFVFFSQGKILATYTNTNEVLLNDFLTIDKMNFSKDFYLEAIKKGNLNPMVFFNMHEFGSKFIENLFNMFVLNVEDTTGCSQNLKIIGRVKYLKKGYYSKEDLNKFDAFKVEYGIDNLDNLISKEVYASTKNQYFIFLTNRNFEELTVPNCSVAQQELFGSQILEE